MSLAITVASGKIETPEEYKYLVAAALKTAISAYETRMSRWIKESGVIPRATGDLQKSGVQVVSASDSFGTAFKVYAGFAAKHAKYAEEGRPAGKRPPIAAIVAWCLSPGVGLPAEAAWPIAKTIAKRGTPGAHFWRITQIVAKTILKQELANAFQRYGFNISVRI